MQKRRPRASTPTATERDTARPLPAPPSPRDSPPPRVWTCLRRGSLPRAGAGSGRIRGWSIRPLRQSCRATGPLKIDIRNAQIEYDMTGRGVRKSTRTETVREDKSLGGHVPPSVALVSESRAGVSVRRDGEGLGEVVRALALLRRHEKGRTAGLERRVYVPRSSWE